VQRGDDLAWQPVDAIAPGDGKQASLEGLEPGRRAMRRPSGSRSTARSAPATASATWQMTSRGSPPAAAVASERATSATAASATSAGDAEGSSR
jgi:hypothetical protein